MVRGLLFIVLPQSDSVIIHGIVRSSESELLETTMGSFSNNDLILFQKESEYGDEDYDDDEDVDACELMESVMMQEEEKDEEAMTEELLKDTDSALCARLQNQELVDD
eukprot:TRINITY_DN3745_c0_g1_i10.p2 TRINITY_DN3745_c0_g1~~TRINITY_DN3745_c0_g1_i10.p2  ORF type:complete len:108 (-),score=18.08 TRINITY_DN3745_c0_g1_i10:96-419(-)